MYCIRKVGYCRLSYSSFRKWLGKYCGVSGMLLLDKRSSKVKRLKNFGNFYN